MLDPNPPRSTVFPVARQATPRRGASCPNPTSTPVDVGVPPTPPIRTLSVAGRSARRH